MLTNSENVKQVKVNKQSGKYNTTTPHGVGIYKVVFAPTEESTLEFLRTNLRMIATNSNIVDKG